MQAFTEFISKIEQPEQKARVVEILQWINGKYPSLETKIAWNQPMFTDHGTFIIGFSVAKKHLAIAPEEAAITKFMPEIEEAGYSCTKGLIRITWENDVDYGLLEKIIEFNIQDKAESTTFWRK
ncbi:iron chaperone [Anaerocolumna sp. AGMB13020]|uniref:iron chaperone n=1 Tax=Anaerocolumna sp. AGMB13020 TaxID=3081750 RepID=UPI0029535B10|nr:iron chaperone [Anaerocolumna sp. AGMB13020]WOO37789.1 iron chaperone [Anaerocolumna sp. AGMB13020]